MSETGSRRLRCVMVNDEEQHSLWSADREPPAAWRHEGFTGTEAECSEHIDEVLERHAPRVAAPVDGAARRLRGRLTDTSRRPAETAAANLRGCADWWPGSWADGLRLAALSSVAAATAATPSSALPDSALDPRAHPAPAANAPPSTTNPRTL